jgi:lambda family phage portal protein
MARAVMGSTGFEGAASGRRLTGWNETDSAISALLSSEGDLLRRRCRGLVRKNPWARSAQDSYVANAIGTGIKPESLHPDPVVRALIHKSWGVSVMEFDSDGLTDFYGLQQLAMREVFQAGESLARFRPRYATDGLLVPLQLQIIPSEHLSYTDNRMGSGGNVIRSGIEFTPYGKRAAYHLWREHPGLGGLTLGNKANMQVPVSADNVLHMFLPRSGGQYRGEPWLAPVMLTLYELDQFVDAVMVRQKLANMFLGWQKRQNLDDPGPMLAASTGPDGSTADGVGFGLLQPGTMLDLDDGDTLEFNTPPGPGAEFASFLKVMLHVFSAGVGVPYEQNTWDLEGVNYSSIRSGLLEFRRRCEQFQFQVMAFQFCRPVWRRWINDAVLAGVLPKPSDAQGWRDLYSVEWRTPAWDWVDPLKDVLAKKEEVRCGFTSRSAVIHERGYDPEQIEAETTADNARADAAGNVYDSDPRNTAGTGTAQAAQQQDQQSQELQEAGKAATK